MKEGKDITSEYERTFGELKKPINLFTEDEEYYNVLRPQITSSRPVKYNKAQLPFKDVQLIPYADYMRMLAISHLVRKGFHLFYLKRFEHGSESFCDAAGYYNRISKKFRIVEYSYIVPTNNFDLFNYDLQVMRRKAIMNRSKVDGKERYLTESIICNDPSIAASYVLGYKADLHEWADRNGNKLISIYPDLLESNQEAERKPESPPKQEKTNASTVIVVRPAQSSKVGEDPVTPKTQASNSASRHIFYLNVPERCKASGYLDIQTNNFYIIKDSLVALFADSTYSLSKSGLARVRFIDKVCKREGIYYRVVKDAKCRSASAAASYVLGREATYVHWIDANGKSLKDCYPTKFFQDNPDLYADVSLRVPASKVIDASQHPFFIREVRDRFCWATGYYDPQTNKILLKKGSVLSFEVTKMFRYTAVEFQRRRFVLANCQRVINGYKLKNDTFIDNPNMAASFIIGDNVDGLTAWRDSEGKTLSEVFNINQ